MLDYISPHLPVQEVIWRVIFLSPTEQDIRNFARFAEQHLSRGGSELSIDELFAMWRAANLSADELAQSVAAVNAALVDMEAGDTGTPADEHLARLRSKFSILQSE